MILTTMFDLGEEKYNSSPLSDKLIAEMLDEKAKIKFACEVTEIIRKRQMKINPHMENWDKNEVLRIKDFNSGMETAVHTYVTLKRLFESEFGAEATEKVEKTLDVLAKELSDHALKTCGWVKGVA